MKYLKRYNNINENNNSELVNIMTSFIDRQLLPDKDFLYECFSEALDSKKAYFLHSSNEADGFLAKYDISSNEPTRNAFSWELYFHDIPKGYKNGVVYKKNRNDLDAVKQYHIDFNELISYVEECIKMVESKYDKYKIKVQVNDKSGFVGVYISTSQYESIFEREVGYKPKDSTYYNKYNPVTFLYRKHGYEVVD